MYRGDAEGAERLQHVSPRALCLGGESKKRAPRTQRGFSLSLRAPCASAVRCQ